jgi:hypothetical protein
MSAYKFSVNVVVRHQSRPAEEIASALGWKPHNAWSAGDARLTPAGTQLSGTRQDTMCAFRFESDTEQATSAVADKVKHLLSMRDYVIGLASEGGTVTLNIGLNGLFSSSLDLSPETLRDLSELGILLSVECFPDG